LSPEFWANIWKGTIAWAVHALPKVLIVLLLGFILLKLVDWGSKRLVAHTLAHAADEEESAARERQKRSETLIGILRKTSVIVVWVFVAMLVLMQVGVNIAPLIAGAGIVGLAVGFGAQELVRDVITGFFVLLENHVRKGDVAIINGTGGLVETIGLRTITLRDLSGTVHVFQNGKISSLSNMTKEWSAMVFDIGVAYKQDTDEVARVMLEVAETLRAEPEYAHKILEPMEVFGLDSFADSSVVIKARLKTVPSEQWSVGREYRRRLKRTFDERGIEIPFPHRTLYWGDAGQANTGAALPAGRAGLQDPPKTPSAVPRPGSGTLLRARFENGRASNVPPGSPRKH
jgi:small conductance mechanosensitive channel